MTKAEDDTRKYQGLSAEPATAWCRADPDHTFRLSDIAVPGRTTLPAAGAAGLEVTNRPQRPRVATVWIGGCSGCHMSLLDMDERLLDLAAQMELVFSPFMDVKEFPEHVDIALVEGAVANQDHLRQIRIVRERSTVLVAFGHAAVRAGRTARSGLEPV